jgi:predicted GH43/DUF377 family glycosyl hydrolase
MSLQVAHRRLVSRGDIPGSAGGVYNPGAVLVGSLVLLLCRREIDYRFSTVVFPESFHVDPDTLAVVGRHTLSKGRYPAGCRIEDFRCIDFDGMLLVAHSLVGRERIKPIISRVIDKHIEPFDDFALPIDIGRIEKNWVLFEKDGQLHCLYKLDPLTILVRRTDGSWRLVKEEENGWADGFERTLSNSTNLIPFMGGYLGFWHTILRGRYVQGAFLLDHDLAIKYRTGILLDGAQVRDGYKPGVLYVSALVEHVGRILAFYGEGDAHTSVAVFDAAALAEELARSPFRAVDALRIRYDGTSMGDLFRAMKTLHSVSGTIGNSRLRLYVKDLHVQPVIQLFKIPNLTVYEQGRRVDYHYNLLGETGQLLPAMSTSQ